MSQIAQLGSTFSHGKESIQKHWQKWEAKSFERLRGNLSATLRWKENEWHSTPKLHKRILSTWIKDNLPSIQAKFARLVAYIRNTT